MNALTSTPRRALLLCALLAATGAARAQQEAAQEDAWPQKPIRLIVPFSAGGGTDILSRLVARELTGAHGWTVVPDNRPGAGGTIGMGEAAKAAPNGYEIVMGQKDNVVLGPYLYKNLAWKPDADLVPVAHVAYTPIVIATRSDAPWQTMAEVIAASRAAPGQITYGSPGNGTSIHLAGVLLEKAAQIQWTHVPYKGSNPALVDALAGNVDLLVSSVPSALGQIKAGKLRALAVTSRARSSSLPDVPTLHEVGMEGFDVSTWYGLFAPRGTPPAIVEQLHTRVGTLLESGRVRQAIQDQGAEAQPLARAEFAQKLADELQAAGPLMRAAGIQID